MYAVIFEVWPTTEGRDEYLEIAANLKPILEKMPGFISIERFTSLVEEGKVLSLSFWESEEAIKGWREQMEHQKAQQKGRYELFSNYRLRVAKVDRDYGPHDRDQAPQ